MPNPAGAGLWAGQNPCFGAIKPPNPAQNGTNGRVLPTKKF